MDAAEALFAEQGFHGPSVRQITERAGTRLAAVNDLFGGKENLFRDVLIRRITPLNEDRRLLLAGLSPSGQPTDRIRELVVAFTLPMLRRAEQDGQWRAYLMLAAQLHGSRDPVLLLVSQEYNSMAEEVISRIRAVFPDRPPANHVDAYLFLVSVALQGFTETGRRRVLADGRAEPPDLRRRYESAVSFATGGILALLTEGDDRPPA
jgi:AcrR family transcriptional regulator